MTDFEDKQRKEELRLIAMFAMQGMLANSSKQWVGTSETEIAKYSVAMANALLAELAKETTK